MNCTGNGVLGFDKKNWTFMSALTYLVLPSTVPIANAAPALAQVATPFHTHVHTYDILQVQQKSKKISLP